jgi:hypothetical protein
MRTPASLLTFCLVLWAGRAVAHPEVERGVRQYYAADLDQALASFARAEAGRGLSRGDVVRLLLFRALVHSAFGSAGARDADLLRLASLAPDAPLPDDAPPGVRDAFARARSTVTAPLTVGLAGTPSGDGARVEIVARVSGDPGGLTRLVHLSLGAEAEAGAEAGAGPGTGLEASAGAGARASVARSGSPVAYRAWAEGPGGAALAMIEGTDALLAVGVPLLPARTTASERATGAGSAPDTDREGLPLWAYAGGGAVLASAITVAVLLIRGAATPSRTQISAPTFVPEGGR